MDGDPKLLNGRGQNPAYRATLLQRKWAETKSPLTFPYIACTSCYITCRRLRDFYGETMGKYGQIHGQISVAEDFQRILIAFLLLP